MKKHVQIERSYNVWRPRLMVELMEHKLPMWPFYVIKNVPALVIEWWLHNIGFYITSPFIFIPAIKKLNLRFRDVDLMLDLEEDENE